MSDIADRVKKIVVEHLGVDEDKVQEGASFIDDRSYCAKTSISSRKGWAVSGDARPACSSPLETRFIACCNDMSCIQKPQTSYV